MSNSVTENQANTSESTQPKEAKRKVNPNENWRGNHTESMTGSPSWMWSALWIAIGIVAISYFSITYINKGIEKDQASQVQTD